MGWRLGLRKSWGACPSCGTVLVESLSRKVTCAGLFLLAVCFIWFGGPWLGSIVARGGIGLASILVAHLLLPGFEVRHGKYHG